MAGLRVVRPGPAYESPDPAATAYKTAFTGRRVPDDGTEFLVTTYFDADGHVLDQQIDERPSESAET